MQKVHDAVHEPSRLSYLKLTGLLDSPPESAFDRLTKAASEFLDVPVALISLVDTDRQFFKSQIGLPQPYADQRETPLSHSFCQHVVAIRAPLMVTDAREVDFLKDNLAIPDLNVIAYLGIPIQMPDGTILGAFCAIDGKPHPWSQRDLRMLENLASSTVTEIILRQELQERVKAEARLRERENELSLVNEKLNRFTGAVAHDLHAPLRRISLNIDLIKNDFRPDLAPGLVASLENLQKQSRKARELIDAFLSYSKSMPADLKMATVDLATVVEIAKTIASEQNPQTDLSIVVSPTYSPVGADRNLLEQVFINLFSNSLKFRGKDNPQITVVEKPASDPGLVRIDVSDNGIGIPENGHHRLFQAFTRLHDLKVSGFGLGLSLCRDIIQAFGGNIWLDHSEPGNTRFAIELKRAA